MFEWLERELETIKTRKFHVIDGPADEELQTAVDQSDLPLPRSYKRFVLRFGNAKLYRKLDGYLLGVLASPREAVSKHGEPLFLIGHYDSSGAYFKESLLQGEEESPVFMSGGTGLQQSAGGFESWLEKVRKSARKRYTSYEWNGICAGPLPLSPEEMKIVEARKHFRWRTVGVSEDGQIQFEVHNASDMVLPYLSIGIRGKRSDAEGVLEGGIWLPVATINPGETKVIEKHCYKKWIHPRDVIAFEKPDPGPEDRDRYWEFRGLSV